MPLPVIFKHEICNMTKRQIGRESCQNRHASRDTHPCVGDSAADWLIMSLLGITAVMNHMKQADLERDLVLKAIQNSFFLFDAIMLISFCLPSFGLSSFAMFMINLLIWVAFWTILRENIDGFDGIFRFRAIMLPMATRIALYVMLESQMRMMHARQKDWTSGVDTMHLLRGEVLLQIMSLSAAVPMDCFPPSFWEWLETGPQGQMYNQWTNALIQRKKQHVQVSMSILIKLLLGCHMNTSWLFLMWMMDWIGTNMIAPLLGPSMQRRIKPLVYGLKLILTGCNMLFLIFRLFLCSVGGYQGWEEVLLSMYMSPVTLLHVVLTIMYGHTYQETIILCLEGVLLLSIHCLIYASVFSKARSMLFQVLWIFIFSVFMLDSFPYLDLRLFVCMHVACTIESSNQPCASGESNDATPRILARDVLVEAWRSGQACLNQGSVVTRKILETAVLLVQTAVYPKLE